MLTFSYFFLSFVLSSFRAEPGCAIFVAVSLFRSSCRTVGGGGTRDSLDHADDDVNVFDKQHRDEDLVGLD